jgi:hypothetical protein
VRLEQSLDRGALHALAPAVDQPDDWKSGRLRLMQILIHDINHIARLKCVQIDRVFYRDLDGRGVMVLHIPR